MTAILVLVFCVAAIGLAIYRINRADHQACNKRGRRRR